jgi:hypothetical protein
MGESETQVATPWYQSTLFWGCAGAFLAIVLTVLAAMMKDIRWLLFFAWPFATFAAWEFARAISNRRMIVVGATGLTAAVTGAMLGWLYLGLAPYSTYFVSSPKNDSQDNQKTETDNKLASTFGKTIFRCARPKQIAGQDLKKLKAETKQNLKAMGEKFGLSIDLKDIENGIALEMTPKTSEGSMRMGGAERWALEIRPSGAELLVYARMQLPSALAGF